MGSNYQYHFRGVMGYFGVFTEKAMTLLQRHYYDTAAGRCCVISQQPDNEIVFVDHTGRAASQVIDSVRRALRRDANKIRRNPEQNLKEEDPEELELLADFIIGDATKVCQSEKAQKLYGRRLDPFATRKIEMMNDLLKKLEKEASEKISDYREQVVNKLDKDRDLVESLIARIREGEEVDIPKFE